VVLEKLASERRTSGTIVQSHVRLKEMVSHNWCIAVASDEGRYSCEEDFDERVGISIPVCGIDHRI
jgi:hypothetical protein